MGCDDVVLLYLSGDQSAKISMIKKIARNVNNWVAWNFSVLKILAKFIII